MIQKNKQNADIIEEEEVVEPTTVEPVEPTHESIDLPI